MRILFGVFDWGLGHATRDTPLIRALLAGGHRVDLLSTGRGHKLLAERFGAHCRLFDVPSIQSPYTRTRFFAASFAWHIPRMLRTLLRARRDTERIIRRNRYDLVISDCRYDVYDQPGNSILINHQLRFAAPPLAEQTLERWLAWQMSHYRCVAVPDFPTNDLSGRLSHDLRYFDRSRVQYIGVLSHVRRTGCERDIDFFISLTGPEPQRTLLEEKVLAQADGLDGRVVIAGGNPDRSASETRGRVEFHSYLPLERQQEMMNRARFLVSRSGYTTLMELCEVGLPRALLVPTPGQTEQEYLGRYLDSRGCFPSVSQADLDLPRDVKRGQEYAGLHPQWLTDESVRRFLAICGV